MFALNHWESILSRFTKIRAGEGIATLYFMLFGFLVMFCFYTLKTLREPLLLSTSPAEIKSYAYAVIAVVMFFVVQLYDAAYRRLPNAVLNVSVGGVLITVQFVFFVVSQSGLYIGFAYYVWTGVFGVLITAQFWAFAADCFNLKTGQRLFPLIMIGISVGGMTGPLIAGELFQILGVHGLMLLVNVALALMLPLASWARRAVPENSSPVTRNAPVGRGKIIGGFSLVLGNHYLRMIAALILLLNWVNTTGEYILAEMVLGYVDQLVAINPALDRSAEIANFYGYFFSAVNALSLMIQVLLVSRVFAWIGVQGAILILPIFAVVGYGVIAFVPIFSVLALVKLTENAIDYSLMNTARQALILPLSANEKYQSKFVIDAFFWRFGDLMQAGVVYLGLRYFDFDTVDFALLNMALALLWLEVAMRTRKYYSRLKPVVRSGAPPRLLQHLPTLSVAPTRPLDYSLPSNLFYSDPGDVLEFTVRRIDGGDWPPWLVFDPGQRRFTGAPPDALPGNIWLTVRATNMDGRWAEVRLGLTASPVSGRRS